MKKILSLVVGALLLCASLGLTGCGEGYANYFSIIKNPKNFRIEYTWQDELFTEIRVGSKVALKTTWEGSGGVNTISKDTEWTIYRNKYKEQSNLAYDSQFAGTTSYYRQDVSRYEYEKSETTFLGREAVLYQRTSVSGYVATPDSEAVDREHTSKFIVDKEYDVVLARYFTWDGDDEKASFEVTLFEIGGQKIPDNPPLS